MISFSAIGQSPRAMDCALGPFAGTFLGEEPKFFKIFIF
jgi:hypothetical protein